MQSQTENSLLREGRGIDHLVIIVRDLRSTAREYNELLGFEMSPTGRHPHGTENSIARFQDETYLELLSVYDPVKAKNTATLLEKFEGAVSVGLNVGSANSTSNFLRSRGMENEIGTGTIKLDETDDEATVLWKWVGFKPGTPISDSIFFIEYTPERTIFRKKHPQHYRVPLHPNTAKSLTSVWTITKNLSEGEKPFLDMGLPINRQGTLNGLDAEYSEFQVGQGTILVLSPSKQDGKTATFIHQRGEQAIIGASVKVSSLSVTRQLLDKNSFEHPEYMGIYGPSLLVDPNRTHGFWLEMYEG